MAFRIGGILGKGGGGAGGIGDQRLLGRLGCGGVKGDLALGHAAQNAHGRAIAIHQGLARLDIGVGRLGLRKGNAADHHEAEDQGFCHQFHFPGSLLEISAQYRVRFRTADTDFSLKARPSRSCHRIFAVQCPEFARLFAAVGWRVGVAAGWRGWRVDC